MAGVSSFSYLETLPVELLYEIELFALSHTLPQASRHLHQVFKCAPISFQSEYILSRILANKPSATPSEIYTRALRYPISTRQVLSHIHQQATIRKWAVDKPPELPRRLFRALTPKKGTSKWREDDEPMPFLRYLYSESSSIPPPLVNAHEGYALTKSVHAGFIPLVQFLLSHGASPTYNNGISVMVAIRQKNLCLLKMLVERSDAQSSKTKRAKRRKLEDRIKMTSEMLKVAVKCNAGDIVKWLMEEKGCVPDLQTVLLMR